MKHCDATTSPSTSAYPLIFLEIRGIGNVPSMKNNKSLFKSKKSGKLFIATNPKKKQWMEKAIQLLGSQLIGIYRTDESGMRGECQKPSLIALLRQYAEHFDDSVHWMIPGPQSVMHVPHGSEGCTITIERIS